MDCRDQVFDTILFFLYSLRKETGGEILIFRFHTGSSVHDLSLTHYLGEIVAAVGNPSFLKFDVGLDLREESGCVDLHFYLCQCVIESRCCCVQHALDLSGAAESRRVDTCLNTMIHENPIFGCLHFCFGFLNSFLDVLIGHSPFSCKLPRRGDSLCSLRCPFHKIHSGRTNDIKGRRCIWFDSLKHTLNALYFEIPRFLEVGIIVPDGLHKLFVSLINESANFL